MLTCCTVHTAPQADLFDDQRRAQECCLDNLSTTFSTTHHPLHHAHALDRIEEGPEVMRGAGSLSGLDAHLAPPGVWSAAGQAGAGNPPVDAALSRGASFPRSDAGLEVEEVAGVGVGGAKGEGSTGAGLDEAGWEGERSAGGRGPQAGELGPGAAGEQQPVSVAGEGSLPGSARKMLPPRHPGSGSLRAPPAAGAAPGADSSRGSTQQEGRDGAAPPSSASAAPMSSAGSGALSRGSGDVLGSVDAARQSSGALPAGAGAVGPGAGLQGSAPGGGSVRPATSGKRNKAAERMKGKVKKGDSRGDVIKGKEEGRSSGGEKQGAGGSSLSKGAVAKGGQKEVGAAGTGDRERGAAAASGGAQAAGGWEKQKGIASGGAAVAAVAAVADTGAAASAWEESIRRMFKVLFSSNEPLAEFLRETCEVTGAWGAVRRLPCVVVPGFIPVFEVGWPATTHGPEHVPGAVSTPAPGVQSVHVYQ